MALEGLLQPTHLIIILIIAVIVFGPSKLPELGASLGKGIREFKKSTQELTEVRDSVTSTVTQAVKVEPTRIAAPAPLPSQPEPRHQGPVTLPRQEIE